MKFCGKCGTKIEEKPRESDTERLTNAKRELGFPDALEKLADLPGVIETWKVQFGHQTTEEKAKIDSRMTKETADIDKLIKLQKAMLTEMKAPQLRCPKNHTLVWRNETLRCIICDCQP
jgi:hypothetical protein